APWGCDHPNLRRAGGNGDRKIQPRRRHGRTETIAWPRSYRALGRSATAIASTSGRSRPLPPGSVYSEPGGGNHFARTGGEAVLVELSGVGPTDTRYVEPALVASPQAGR